MKIDVVKNVLEASESLAGANRERLAAAGVVSINLMSAPGSGKTTLLQKTICALGPQSRSAVLVGDLQTSRDAERLAGLGAQVIQINTGSGCHLSPTQVARGLDGLALRELQFLFIENVGNMVCPAAFDLGEQLRVVLLSSPEGDDKVAKYPTLFQGADAILLTKMDLIELLGFSVSRVQEDLAKINTHAPLIRLSAQTGEGMDPWLAWLRGRRDEL